MTPHISTKARKVLTQSTIGIGLVLVAVAMAYSDTYPWLSCLSFVHVGYFWICASKIEDHVIRPMITFFRIIVLLAFLVNVFALWKLGDQSRWFSSETNTAIVLTSFVMFIGRLLPELPEQANAKE